MADLLGLLDVGEARAIVTTRDWFATAESQVARCLVPDADAAFANMRRAYGEIFAALAAASAAFVLSSYEAMITKPEYARRLLELLDLPTASVETYDGNEKWYAEGLDREGRIRMYPALKRG